MLPLYSDRKSRVGIIFCDFDCGVRQEASWLLDQGQMVLGHHSQLAQTRAAVSPVSTTTAVWMIIVHRSHCLNL